MSIGRVILAVVIAISVAMLPVAGSAAASTKSPETATMSADMSMMDDMSDCCPNHAEPCDKAISNCTACCVSNYIAIPARDASFVTLPMPDGSVVPRLASNPFSSQPSNPPFRPPRT